MEVEQGRLRRVAGVHTTPVTWNRDGSRLLIAVGSSDPFGSSRLVDPRGTAGQAVLPSIGALLAPGAWAPGRRFYAALTRVLRSRSQAVAIVDGSLRRVVALIPAVTPYGLSVRSLRWDRSGRDAVRPSSRRCRGTTSPSATRSTAGRTPGTTPRRTRRRRRPPAGKGWWRREEPPRARRGPRRRARRLRWADARPRRQGSARREAGHFQIQWFLRAARRERVERAVVAPLLARAAGSERRSRRRDRARPAARPRNARSSSPSATRPRPHSRARRRGCNR